MSKVAAVTIKKQGTSDTGKAWTMYQVETEEGIKATGFDQIHVGDYVEISQDGKFLNYKKIDKPKNGAAANPSSGYTTGATFQPPSGLDERQRAIIRQHSQSMAMQVLTLKGVIGELRLEDLTPEKLQSLADYFDKDVMEASK